MQMKTLDRRIRHVKLELERDDLENLPVYPLPEGYRFVFWQPGDERAWLDIEGPAGEFDTDEQGMVKWNKYFAPHTDELGHRMVFIEDAQGRKVATASAYFDVRGKDSRDVGYLHWVAVHPDAQGKGLAKPLISYVLSLLREMGHTHTKIITQTTSWLAVGIYMSFGFRPEKENAVEGAEGWRIIRTLLDKPGLEQYDKLPPEECLVAAEKEMP